MNADHHPQRYPLHWPAGWPRTARRQHARFHASSQRLTVGGGLTRLLLELRRLGAAALVISSNMAVRQDGLPYAQQRRVLDDPGVAVYFKLRGAPRCLACDRWDSVADNMAALAAHIAAIRAVDRYGVGTLEQAFAGYAALPAHASPWWTVLEFADRPRDWSVVETRHRDLTRRYHPDVGGDPDVMAKINAARDAARLDLQ